MKHVSTPCHIFSKKKVHFIIFIPISPYVGFQKCQIQLREYGKDVNFKETSKEMYSKCLCGCMDPSKVVTHPRQEA